MPSLGPFYVHCFAVEWIYGFAWLSSKIMIFIIQYLIEFSSLSIYSFNSNILLSWYLLIQPILMLCI